MIKSLENCKHITNHFAGFLLRTQFADQKAHTLMQAIARANRVNEGMNNGLIVDYCGILKNLLKARLILDMGDEFHRWEAAALWDDVRFGLRHRNDFDF